MSPDAPKTREAILQSAKEEFLCHGFASASLRVIATGAGVTTGALYRHFADKDALFEALIAPVRDEVIQRFDEQTNEYIRLLDDKGLEPLWQPSAPNADGEATWNIRAFVRYVYRHFDEFRLLLLSEQTVRENFLHTLIRLEIDSTRRYLEAAQKQGYPVGILEERELHLLANAQFTALVELVSHQIPEEDGIRYMATVERFLLAGWKEIILGKY